MSALIDNLAFQTFKTSPSADQKSEEPTVILEILRKLKVNQKCHLAKNHPNAFSTCSTVDLPLYSFMLQLNLTKDALNPQLTAVLLDSLLQPRASSKHNDLLLMKMLLKRSKEFPLQAYAYVNRGRVFLKMNTFTSLSQHLTPSRIADFYNSLIIKNLLNFENFIARYILEAKKDTEDDQLSFNLFQKQLQVARVSNTTHSTSNISIAKSQFKYANSSLQKQKFEINAIKQTILEQACYERTIGHLYQHVADQVSVDWLRGNYIGCYLQNEKKLNALLAYTKPGVEKKVQDFVYNTVQIQVKDILKANKPVNEGGFSYIFAAKADVVYVSSTDMNRLHHNCQKTEKLLAIKKLKPSELKKTRNKVQHEKQIVAKMRGSVCPFIPKYYATKQQSEFSSALIMQFVQGEEMDAYLLKHSCTLSLWSKIYLLINVVHAVQHLANYQIVHLDLKPVNVLVSKNMVPKLIDMGQAYHPQVCNKDYTPSFTFPYVAPEVYLRFARQSLNRPPLELQYSQKQDMFAFGVMLYESLFEGKIFELGISKFKEIYAKRQVLQRFMLAPERTQAYGHHSIMPSILSLVMRAMQPQVERRPRFEWAGICLKLLLNSYINIS